MFILLTQILCCQMRNWRISLLSKGYDFAYFFVFFVFLLSDEELANIAAKGYDYAYFLGVWQTG